MAVIATAALVSCRQEKSFNDLAPIGENSIVFTVRGGASTRSVQEASEVRQGVVVPLETQDGKKFVLEETVVNLNEFVPATKGAPAYTENLGTLYANDLSVYAAEGTFGTATYENMENSLYDRKETSQGKGWRYQHNYDGDPWPEDGTPVGFYLNMPAAPKNVSFDGRTGGKFTFSYTSPAEAAEQQDILFAYSSMTKEDHEGFLPNGAPVLFNHALTAVKFRIGNDGDDIKDNKIAITEVIFKGLIDKGTCEITPTTEVTDVKDTYSSAGVTLWKDTTSTKTPITTGTIGGTVEYDASDKKFGESWYSSELANTQNLNNANATQTFWLIPQVFPEGNNVTLTIKYTFDGHADEWTIDIGSFFAASNVEWKAGDLRTYTIKVDDVNVRIEDSVSVTGDEDDGYTGSSKTDVTISNTGNTDAYIRAALLGQWLDEKENPVFGFTDDVFALRPVASWYEDQFISTTHEQGTFTGLVGYNGAGSDYWVKGKDGYYYFIYVVPATTGTIPGAYKTVANGEAEEEEGPSDPLFEKYTVGKAPNAAIADLDVTIHFELEIATQAVSAKNTDGSYLTWIEAWKKALGYDPTKTDPTAQ